GDQPTADDHAIAGERLMAVFEHEEMLRMVEEAFFVDVAMVGFVEPVIDGLDQAADDLLKGFEGAVDLGDGDGTVFGVDDNGAHGGASGSGVGSEPGRRSLSRPGSLPSGWPLTLAACRGDSGGTVRADRAAHPYRVVPQRRCLGGRRGGRRVPSTA